ncbi:MAG: hypothetical protein VB035_06180 [Candidatus Fimivivens sp.]|nr:hypothetical protein [Candidatus Fimivivens sp.]
MQLYLSGVDIAAMVGINNAVLIDNAGGLLDSTEVAFSDTQNLWSSWAPQIDDVMRIVANGFDTGDCFIDQIGQENGLYVLRGLSVPSGAKAKKTRSWEKVTLLQLAADVAANLGFTLAPYDVPNPTYSWADQISKTDLRFLQERCMLEGVAVKVNGRKLILYSESGMERQSISRVIRKQDFWQPPNYSRKRQGTYAGVTVSYGAISGGYSAPGRGGEMLTKEIYVTSIGEAQRFAKGLLRSVNKNEHYITGMIELDLSLAGGSMVQVQEIGTADGLYMVDQVEHQLTNKITALRLRRRLEGY